MRHDPMLDFDGAKAALLAPSGLVVMRRDAHDRLPWPARVDLPGGGREADETPRACAAREVAEEVGLIIAPHRFGWARAWPRAGRWAWLCVARIDLAEAAAIRLGSEGTACWVEPPAVYLSRGDAIPHHQARLRIALRETGAHASTFS